MKPNFRLLAMVVFLTGLQTMFAADSALPKLAAANNIFAFKLLKQLTLENQSGNIFVSPYSVATALQMVANGAAGQTKLELQQVLETSGISVTELNEAVATAIDRLNPKDTNTILTTANSLWYRQGTGIKPDFLEVNQKVFSATYKALDFNDAPKAEAEINQWASDQTHGRIQGIADHMIAPNIDLILANAIYFKGTWEFSFDPKLTRDRRFHSADGTATKHPMMEKSGNFNYLKGNGYQAVQLPYTGRDLMMYVLLPDPGSSPAKLLEALSNDKQQNGRMPYGVWGEGFLVLPKFKIENRFELKPTLQTLGMRKAFEADQADFSGMFNDSHYISKVRQKAFVEVNEAGTEAAAATAVSGAYGAVASPPKPFEMIIDRPFLFAITDTHSGMILFMGVVNDL